MLSETISTFPYTEAFDTTTPPSPPTGWSYGGATTPFVTSATSSRSAPNSARNGSTNGSDTIISDTVNYTGYNNIGLSFWYRGTAAANLNQMEVRASIDGGSTYPITVVASFTSASDSVYHQVTASNIIALNGQSNVKYKWICENDTSTYGNINIDDIVFTASSAGTAPTVATNAATSVGTTTATLNGDVTSDGGATITERGFYCDTNSSPTTKYTVSGTTGAYTKDMTSLSPGTKYYFKAYATNSVGTSYGSILDFTTTTGVSATATGPTGSTDNTSVTLTYTYTGSPTSVKLYYTKDAGTSWTLAGEDTSVDETFSYSITSGDGTYGWIAVAIGGGSTETDPPAGGTSPEASPLILDTVAPTVTDVTSTAPDETYRVGQVIPVTVTFSEVVNVTGTPQLTLATGGAGTAVDYTSGSGTATLTFNYTVAAGDSSADLDYVATNSLALNSGTIKDAGGNDATLTLPAPGAAGSLGANKNIVIDTTSAGSGDYWVDDPTDAPVSGGYGEAIVGAQGKIYLAQTYNVSSPDYFYVYNPATNAWSPPLSVSGLPGGGTGDFKNGTALVWDNGNYIYSLLGGTYGDTGRYFFYRYLISGNSWTAMANTPTDQTAGGALAWVPGSVLGISDDNYIYACLGDHSAGFARYSIKYDSWTIMANAPGGKDDGCSLVWTGDNYLFALQGEKDESGYNDAAWRYNIITNTWDLTGKFATEVGDGGSMIWTGGDYIYALSGCTSGEDYRDNFYRYNFKTGLLRQTDWVPLADLPESIGDFVGCRIGFTWTSVGSSVGDIYGWRGVPGGFKFWRYMLPIPSTSWTQTDWKGGPTKPSLQVGKWSENYDNFYDNENVNWSQAGKIMLENAPAPPPPGIADHVVISEFATNGSGAYDEFVELYNPTDHDINVENWNFWYFTEYPTGSGIYVWLYTSPYSPYSVTIGTIPIENATFHPIIKSCGFLLWANSRGYFSPGSGPTPDWTTYGNGMSDAGPRGIQLRLADNVTVVDTVVYEGDGGTSNSEAEGGKTAPNCGATTNSVERKAQSTSTADTLFEPDGADATNGNGCDTDNNANDWVRQTNGRGPENSASPLEYPLSVAFKSAGWFESSIYDAGELADWKSVFWSESKPSGTDIIVKLRTGGGNDPYDGGWSGWYQHTNHTENTLMANGRYVQYRVEFSATDDTTTPQLSDILISYNIGIDNTAPPAPALVSPSNGAVLSDNTPTFEWTSVSDPSGVTYDIQVDNDPDFSSPEVNVAGLTDNTYTSSALAYEGYSWRVRAVDGAGNIGNWSDVWQFTISQPPSEWSAIWSAQPGIESEDATLGVAIDGDYIYTAGETTPRSGGSLTNLDILIMKYDKDNHLLWENTWDSGDHDFGQAVAVGSDGVYVVGSKYTSANGYQGVILKYSKDGAYQWDREWGGTGFLDSFEDVAVGPDDNIYVVGIQAAGLDAVLVKYDKDGNVLNSVTWGGAGDDRGDGIFVSSSAVYICGRTGATTFLAKYDFSLVKQWDTTWNGAAMAVAVAGENIYVVGVKDTGGAQKSNGYLCKFTDGASPTFQWENTLDNSSRYDGFCGVTTLGENVYVAGWTGAYDTRSDLILLKYSSAGTKLWQKNWGERDGVTEDTYDAGGDVAIGSDGIYVTGVTSAPGTDVWDALLIKYNIDQTDGNGGTKQPGQSSTSKHNLTTSDQVSYKIRQV
jgi:hypothetical protein